MKRYLLSLAVIAAFSITTMYAQRPLAEEVNLEHMTTGGVDFDIKFVGVDDADGLCSASGTTATSMKFDLDASGDITSIVIFDVTTYDYLKAIEVYADGGTTPLATFEFCNLTLNTAATFIAPNSDTYEFTWTGTDSDMGYDIASFEIEKQ